MILDWWLGGTLGPAGQLDWQAPQWQVVLAVSLAVLAWALVLVGRRRWLPWVAEALLWGGALAVAVIAVARPVWVEEEGREEPGRVAVLVDASRSMSIVEAGSARSAEAEARLESLIGRDVDIYQFGDDLAVGRPDAFDLPGTDLEGALEALSERVAGERLAGVVVITDGLDRGLLRRRFRELGAGAQAPRVPGPLTVVQVGTAGDLRDLAVRAVETGGYAFLRNPFRITADIEGLGFAGRKVPVTLARDGAPITTTEVTLSPDGRAVAEFDVKPTEEGRFTFTVEVPEWDGDAVKANNVATVVVRVVRDRVRVLQVAGAPSWDVKFLRRFLKGDPSVDLVSFFILRTNEDLDAGYATDELSLIEFPYERLFMDEIRSFDVVIFHNFDYRPYFGMGWQTLLGNVASYVTNEGHGFAMIGGERSFDLGQYARTPLGDVLPVTLGMPRGDAVAPDAFVPRLTDEGARHPVTRLVGDPAENAEWWGRLHALDGANRVVDLAPGATALLEHPSATTRGGAPLPVLAVREVGAGRSMSLLVDSSWRWSMSEAAEGRGNQAYLRFWKNAIRWLIADPAASRVTVDVARENYAMDDKVRIVVRARDAGFGPLEGARAEIRVTGPRDEVLLVGDTKADGELVREVPATIRGAHRVEVVVSGDEGEIGRAETVFAVTTRDAELDEVSPDSAFLRWLAGSVEGRFFGPGEAVDVLRASDAGRVVWDRRETPLWQAPVLALLVGLLSGLAWIIRRRSGMR